MDRPPLEVADIVRAAGDTFIERNRHWLRWMHVKVLRAIAQCRTAALGGHLDECTRCRHRAISFNSCRNRHCPKCQAAARERWIAARQRELLPTRYLHVVFTLPHRLAPLVLQNKSVLYNLLFRTSAETLLEVARNPRHLGAEIGFFSVLHTWSQKLKIHPHVHCVVPAGGLSLDHTRWIRSRDNYFLPEEVLSELFRGKFVDALKQAFHNGQLNFQGDLKLLAEPKTFAAWLRPLHRQDWVVYLKRPFGGPEYVLRYLGRYTHRVAISNHRLVSFVDGQVTFHWRDSADHNKQKPLPITVDGLQSQWSPGSYSSEICRAEQLLALDLGVRVIPVLVVALKGSDRPLYLYARQYRDFTDNTKYAARLGELVADICGDATAELPDTYRKTPVTYVTAPPPVTNYLERPDALRALRDAVFAEDHRQPIALTALAGMGGIGKTVLAKALTEKEVVQRAFPDGIVWLTAGKERKRDFIDEMREVAKALGEDLRGYDTALACQNQYRTTIAKKAALIVVDDVWSKADIEPLLAESPPLPVSVHHARCNWATGTFAHNARSSRDRAGSSKSARFHRQVCRRSRALSAAADELIAECGRLPLALSVVGGMLRGTGAEFWKDTLDLLRKADLSAIQDQLPATGQPTLCGPISGSAQRSNREHPVA